MLKVRAELRLGITGSDTAVGLSLLRAVDARRAGLRFGIGGVVGDGHGYIHRQTPPSHTHTTAPTVLSEYDQMPVLLNDDRGRGSG